MNGLFDLPLWGYVAWTLGLTHLTIVSVTLYLHRCQAHRAVDLHPAVAHFFRFWLWLTTGMVTREWVAVHRKHHARVETEEDPHSPVVFGLRKLLLEGAELYRAETRREETLAKYGRGTPDDWLERNLYSRHPKLGVISLAVLSIVLFGPLGLTIWAVQMLWIPFWAAGVVNGLGHWWGYRHFKTPDTSTNIVPVGILIGGEELHNNHHAFPSSARFAIRRWEFDIGWCYIRALQALGLAKVRNVAPQTTVERGAREIDKETVRAFVVGRLHVVADYQRRVMMPVLKEEMRRANRPWRRLARRVRRGLTHHEPFMKPEARGYLQSVFLGNRRLETVYQYKMQLLDLWRNRSGHTQEHLAQAIQEWCRQAEATGVRALEDFARTLRGYRLQAQPV